jgi:hypothetical protein
LLLPDDIVGSLFIKHDGDAAADGDDDDGDGDNDDLWRCKAWAISLLASAMLITQSCGGTDLRAWDLLLMGLLRESLPFSMAGAFTEKIEEVFLFFSVCGCWGD